MPTQQFKVIASALNVRRRPSLSGPVLGLLRENEIVDWIETHEDGNWHKVRNDELEGWASARYLSSYSPTVPGTPKFAVIEAAITSPLVTFHWPNRGRAPLGYLKGMALVFARAYCKLVSNHPDALEMAQANTGIRDSDALAHYADQFEEMGMNNDATGPDTLRHLYVLMMGLGMRESSGKHCTGRDRSANNTSSITAEAGLFQTSFNAKSSNAALLGPMFDRYSNNPSGFLDEFSEDVSCDARDWENYGSGDGREFQRLSKECPAFGAEFAAIVLRNRRRHYGPINRREAKTHPGGE